MEIIEDENLKISGIATATKVDDGEEMKNSHVEKKPGEEERDHFDDGGIERMTVVDLENVQNKPEVSRLGTYVRTLVDIALLHKQENKLNNRLETCQRLNDGEYTESQMVGINSVGGCNGFFNITSTKTEGFQSMVTDILTKNTNGKIWGLQPTPLPELPEDVKQEIMQQVMQEYAQAEKLGQPIAYSTIYERSAILYDERLVETQEEAKEAAKRMEAKMRDQHEQTGFMTEFCDTYLHYFSVYPFAVMKGPIVINKKIPTWNGNEIIIKTEKIPTWKAVSPYDLYWGKNAKNLQDSYVIEKEEVSGAALSMFKGVTGWDSDAIDRILLEPPLTSFYGLNGESTRRRSEGRTENVGGGDLDTAYCAYNVWATMQGSMLEGFGFEDIQPNEFYPVNCFIIGDEVAKAVINPMVMNNIPYYSASYINKPNSIAGKSIPEKMKDCQNGYNVVMRSLMNNVAIASGPQVSVDLDLLEPGSDPTQVSPLKVWGYRSSKLSGTTTSGKEVIKFFQPSINADQLHKAGEILKADADEITRIPRYAQGNNAGVKGAGETASGLSMLMDAASSGARHSIQNMMTGSLFPLLKNQYLWNLKYLGPEYDSLKGDAEIVATGMMKQIIDDKDKASMLNFMNTVQGNPMALQMIGVERFMKLLTEIGAKMGLDTNKFIPSEDEVKQKVVQMNSMAQAQPQQQQKLELKR